MANNKLTAASCNAARLSSDEKERLIGDGQGLHLYLRPSGKSWLFIFTSPNGKRRKMSLGQYPAVSLSNAREKAAAQRALIARGIDPIELRDAPPTSTKTFGDLINAYLGTLAGKPSQRQAESLFRTHVSQSLKDKAASAITTDEIADVLSSLVVAEKRRSAAVLRSYTARAFKLAFGASRNPNTPPALRGFGLTADPTATIEAIEGGTGNTCERCLTVDELRSYASNLEALPATQERDVALIALFSGGQRSTQLLRATVALDGSTLILMDPKGRRAQPRLHRIPITQGSKLHELIGGRIGRLWDVPEAEVETTQMKVSNLVRCVAKKMNCEHFNLRDIRRSLETALVAAGISLDVTAQLMSHALSGLQHRNYLRHDFDNEKRRALATLEKIITGTDDARNVVQLQGRS